MRSITLDGMKEIKISMRAQRALEPIMALHTKSAFECMQHSGGKTHLRIHRGTEACCHQRR